MRRPVVTFWFCTLLFALPALVVSQTPPYADQVKAIQDDARVKSANEYIDRNHDSILREWITSTEINAPSKQEQERAKYLESLLRKYKVDEIPQLMNVLTGDMSMVGPRPEVRKYVQLYTEEQRQILKVKPGITDLASITYENENEMLAGSVDPEQTYIQYILPHKIQLNMNYINNPSLQNYFSITLKTISRVLFKRSAHAG